MKEVGTAQSHWTVLPFKEDAFRIVPRRVVGRGKAAYTALLRNDGNAPAYYTLSGEDDEQKLAYRFAQDKLTLEPGTEARVPLQVEQRRRWLGKEQRQPFQVHSRPAGSSVQMTDAAEFVDKPLLPGKAVSAVVGLLVLLALY